MSFQTKSKTFKKSSSKSSYMNERTPWYKVAPLTLAVTLTLWLGTELNYSTKSREEECARDNCNCAQIYERPNNKSKLDREKDKSPSNKLLIPVQTSF